MAGGNRTRFLESCNLSPTAERNQLRNLSVLFIWQCQSTTWPRIHAEELRLKAQRKGSRQEILRISELRNLLTLARDGLKVEAAEEEKGAWRKKFGAISILIPPMDMVPVITVGCFAGVRPDESARMEWEFD